MLVCTSLNNRGNYEKEENKKEETTEKKNKKITKIRKQKVLCCIEITM